MLKRVAVLVLVQPILGLVSLSLGFSQDIVETEVLSTESIVERALPGTVIISVVTSEGDRQGSGFLIDDLGTIVTNYHVIANAVGGKVTLPSGDTYWGFRILSTDEQHDLATIQISATNLPHLNLGNSDSVRVGQEITAIGAPQGLESTVSTGIISAVREVEGFRLLQLTAPISPGSSGGPIISRWGRVIGVAVFQIEGQNLNFAVPINYLHEMHDDSANSAPVSIAPLVEKQGEFLRYDAGSHSSYTYVRIQQDNVTQTMNGIDHKAEVKSYWRFKATTMTIGDDNRRVDIVHDSIMIQAPPQPANDYRVLYGKPVQILMNDRGAVSEVVVPRSIPDSVSRLDLPNTYRVFFPVLPVQAVEPGGSWTDAVNMVTTQNGLDMTIQRVYHYTLIGSAEYAGHAAIQVDFTAEIGIQGSGSQQGSDISLSGEGTGIGSFYFLPDPGVYLGGTETSEVHMSAFVVAEGQNRVIPIVQQREETIELVD